MQWHTWMHYATLMAACLLSGCAMTVHTQPRQLMQVRSIMPACLFACEVDITITNVEGAKVHSSGSAPITLSPTMTQDVTTTRTRGQATAPTSAPLSTTPTPTE